VGEYSPGARPRIAPRPHATCCRGLATPCIRPQPALQCEQVFVSGHRPPEQGAVQTWI
jgi:hypothetical protein